MTDVRADTAEIDAVAGDFQSLSRNASAVAEAFRSQAHGFDVTNAFGDARLAATYESSYQQALGAINQATASLAAIGQKLNLVATNYTNASQASTPKSSQ